MNKSETLGFRADAETAARLREIAASEQRSRSNIIGQAVENYLELREWQQRKIKAAVQSAEAGDFATDDELTAVIKKHRG